MDSEIQELKELVRRSIELGEENNKMLHSMRRSARWGTFFRLIYWVLILGTFGASIYYALPYLQQFQDAYSGVQHAFNGEKTPQSDAFFQNLMNSFSQYAPKN
jgi:hypothetical protein